jgi:hypothetical protein
MPSSNQMARPHVRKLARQGRLVDEAFKIFQRAVFSDAPPDQVAVMRTCFYAGAAELWALQLAALDDGDDVSDAEADFTAAWVAEIETFHARTIAAMGAAEVRN